MKRDAAPAMRGNVGRAFLGGAIDVSGDFLAMPMQLFRSIGVIENIYRYLAAFLKADERSGELTVVSDS